MELYGRMPSERFQNGIQKVEGSFVHYLMMRHDANCFLCQRLFDQFVNDLLWRFQAGAILPSVQVESDRDLLKPVARHIVFSPHCRKRAKAEMIERPIGVF